VPNTRIASSFRVILIALVVLVSTLAASAQDIQSGQPYLLLGQTLHGNGYLLSRNRAFFAQVKNPTSTMFGDFSIHKGSGPDQNFGEIWTAKEQGIYGGERLRLVIQPDANLCVYKTSAGPYWCKDFTARPNGTYFAVMQDDGNLCIYQGTPTAQGQGVWCSGSNTPVTWSVDGKQMKFLGMGGYGQTTLALQYNGSKVEGTQSLTGTQTRWVITGDGMIRWAHDNRMCLTAGADANVTLQSCNGSAGQTGWYQHGDRTLRKYQAPNDCFDIKYDSRNWRDGIPMPQTAVITSPCPTEHQVMFTIQ
jgi:hypothetical protein